MKKLSKCLKDLILPLTFSDWLAWVILAVAILWGIPFTTDANNSVTSRVIVLLLFGFAFYCTHKLDKAGL